MGTVLWVIGREMDGRRLGWFDGLGRTVRTVERNRSPGSATVETFGTDLEYNSLGAVTRMERGLLAGDDRWAGFASGESVAKLQRYDTLGRRIRNLDPDAGEYRYAYDAIDRLVATQDARGILNRYWYDRGGRLVAEDLGGEVPYDADGWETAGGADGVTCPLGLDNLPVQPLPEGG
ncbi:MAG: RHS repeat protein, partial [Myxococcales bacterium]|nr:RHS repeat protein [Myxococcales bacterium]